MTQEQAKKIEADIIARSIESHGAVNLTGVIFSLYDDMNTLKDIEIAMEYGHEWTNNHLAIREYIDAIYWLNRANETRRPMFCNMEGASK